MLAIGESRFLNAKVNHIPGGLDRAVCGLLNWKSGHSEWAFDAARHGRSLNQRAPRGKRQYRKPDLKESFSGHIFPWASVIAAVPGVSAPGIIFGKPTNH